MELSFVYLFMLFWMRLVQSKELSKPCRCIPVRECELLSDLSQKAAKNWIKKYSCHAVRTVDKNDVSRGVQSLRIAESVCCPEKKYNSHQDLPLETSAAYVRDAQINPVISKDINHSSNHYRAKRDESGNAGTIDSINSQINARNLERNNSDVRSNTRRNQNRAFRSNEFPTFDKNGRPIFTNNNDAGRGSRQTRRPDSTEIVFEDTTAYPNMNVDIESRRRNQIRGRENNMMMNQRPNDPIIDNPYFIPRNQNPPGREMQMGNSRNDNGFNNALMGNSRNYNGFNNAQIGNSQNGNSLNNRNTGQCSVLSSIPPDPSTGCCGRDPSRNMNTGNFGGRAPVSNFSPEPMPSRIQGTDSLLGDFFQGLFNLGNGPSRFKRASDMNITIDSRITGGKMTELNQFPWTVLLKTTFNYGNTDSAFACGGSLISAKYVLTAAHCVVEEEARVSQVEITLAEYDKLTFPQDCINGPDGTECIENLVTYAEDVIPHPQYDDARLQNDIALLRLRGRAPYTGFIRPICLPPIDIDSPDFVDLPLSVAGWGRDGRYTSNVKQSTVVNLVPQRECRRSYSQLTRRHLCAAGYSGEDTCKGDSGGPLMMLYEGQYYVSGVVSGKRADSPCGTSVPSLYTNVFHYLDWIRSNIRN